MSYIDCSKFSSVITTNLVEILHLEYLRTTMADVHPRQHIFQANRNSDRAAHVVAIGSPHRHYNSPINNLPIELLGEIYQKFLWSDINLDKQQPRYVYGRISVHPAISTTPITLSHVCRHWRDAVLSMALLWSSISINTDTRTEIRQHLIAETDRWLRRSGTYPLKIFLSENMTGYIQDEGNATGVILSRLIEEFHRWSEISLTFIQVPPTLSRLPVDGAALLKSASFKMSSCSDAHVELIWRSFLNSSALRQFYWSTFRPLPVLLHVPPAEITHLILDCSCTPKMIMNILHACPKVEAVEVVFSNPLKHTPFCPPNPLNLECLQSLSISSTFDLAAVFDDITLPKLQSLYLRYTISGETAPEPGSVTRFLSRSQCSLEDFHLFSAMGETHDDHIFVYLASMGSLKTLELDLRVTDETLYSLTRRGDDYLLPRLEDISLSACLSSDGILSDMIMSRLEQAPGASVLKAVKVTVVTFGVMKHTEDPWVTRKLKEDGLDVDVVVL